MTPRRAGVAAVVVVGLATAGWLLADSGERALQGSLDALVQDAGEARRPFGSLTEVQAHFGGRRVELVVADDPAERSEGLRGREDLGPYDGMLFVYAEPSGSWFTMSGVPVPLDIGFYDRRGHELERLHMAPCHGSGESCPLYGAERPFRYALETLAGQLPRGRLGVGSDRRKLVSERPRDDGVVGVT